MKRKEESNKYEKIVVTILLLVVMIPAIFLRYIYVPKFNIELNKELLKVGTHTIKLNDIKNIELLEEISVKWRKKGTRTHNYLNGVYYVSYNGLDPSPVILKIYNDTSLYIKLDLGEDVFIFNEKSNLDTQILYKSITIEIKNNNS